MAIRFRAREFRSWSRRHFMVRALEAMAREGQPPPGFMKSVRESFHRLAAEDDRLRRLFA